MEKSYFTAFGSLRGSSEAVHCVTKAFNRVSRHQFRLRGTNSL